MHIAPMTKINDYVGERKNNNTDMVGPYLKVNNIFDDSYA